MPIYTVTLSPYDFGIADLLNNFLQLILPIATLSIADAVFRFSLDKDSIPSELLANGLRILGYSYFAVTIYFFIIYFLKLDTYWYVFGFLYIVESLKTLLAQFARGLGKVKEYALNGIIAGIVLLTSSYLFLKTLKLGILGYLWAYIAADISAILYLLFIVDIKRHLDFKRNSNKHLLKSMIIFSLPLTPNMLSWWITNISSRYIIAGICGVSLSGLFAAASKTPALINVVSSIFQLSWQFASVKEHQKSNDSPFYTVVFNYYSMTVMVFGSVVIALTPIVSLFILKGDYYEAWHYTPLLMFSAVLGCYSMYFGTFYSVMKDNQRGLKITMAGAIVNISLCLILIPICGVYGALIANCISYIIIVYLRIRDCKQYVLIKINRTNSLICVLLLLLESVFMTTANHVLHLISYSIPLLILSMHLNLIITLFKKSKQYLLCYLNSN